jgi:hypothetical protein
MVQNLLIQYGQWEGSERGNPFGYVIDEFPEAREIMIFSPSPLARISESERQWARLYESSVPLPWQKEGQTLMESYTAEARYFYKAWENECRAERVTRVDFCDPDVATPP